MSDQASRDVAPAPPTATAVFRDLSPVHVLEAAFREAARAAFGDAHAGVDPMLRASQHADFQANLAMALGKAVKKPPRDVAAALVEKLALDDVCERVEIAGPGFVNLTLKASFVTSALAAMASDAQRGLSAETSETVVVDYSAPNVAKEMHVGHLRSTIIGDAISRVLEALGHRVIRQNHVGDWGTQFGMLIEHMLDLGDDARSQLSMGELTIFYQAARKKFDAEPEFADRARRRVVALQSGDEATLALWRGLVEKSAEYFETVYTKLGVKLRRSDLAGESKYNPMLPDTLSELTTRGLLRESDGAMCVFPEGFKGKEGAPLPLIARKKDGGFGYATTDLAAIRHRTQTLGATRIIYVVGSPQAQHLAMVYQAGREAGWLVPPARAEHVAFGSVLGEDKKMLRTREGDNVRLIDLIVEAIVRARRIVDEKSPDLTEDERARVAAAVGVGALKYADLASDRIKDYVFDYNRMLSFDGNTAVYMMYAHARVCSILRKGAALEGTGDLDPRDLAIEAPAERRLALALMRFGSTVKHVGATLEPHHLCGYLYEVAQAVSAFWDQCPVLRADSPSARRSRLMLCRLTADVLARGLDLLGIEAPERL